MPKAISPLRKFEKRFEEIDSTSDAQFIANESKKLLFQRKKELLRELSRRVSIKKNGSDIRIKIFGLNNTIIAEVKLDANYDITGKSLFIDRLSVGEFIRKNKDFLFKEKDPLRGLDIGKLLLNIIKIYAKRNNYYKIELGCKKELYYKFYKENGFRIVGFVGEDLYQLEYHVK